MRNDEAEEVPEGGEGGEGVEGVEKYARQSPKETMCGLPFCALCKCDGSLCVNLLRH